MTAEDIIRSWKSRTAPRTELIPSSLDEHPAGRLILEDELEPVNGASSEYLFTIGCCSGFTHVPSTCTCTWGSSCPSNNCDCRPFTACHPHTC